ATVDGVIAGAAGDDVGSRGSGDGRAGRQPGCIDALEVGHRRGVAAGLVGVGKIDVGDRMQDQRVGAGATINRNFGIVVRDRIVAAARIDYVGTAAAVNRVVGGAGRDRVRRGGTGDGDRRREGGRIDV